MGFLIYKPGSGYTLASESERPRLCGLSRTVRSQLATVLLHHPFLDALTFRERDAIRCFIKTGVCSRPTQVVVITIHATS